jgi:hypothetical protein
MEWLVLLPSSKADGLIRLTSENMQKPQPLEDEAADRELTFVFGTREARTMVESLHIRLRGAEAKCR